MYLIKVVRTCVILLSIFLMTGALSTPARGQARGPAIYLLAGGNYHKTETCSDLLIQFLRGKTRFPIRLTMLRYDLTKLEEYNAVGLILITQGGVLSQEEMSALLRFGQSGRGIVGIHAAADSFDDAGEVEAYTNLIGGWFQRHPARGPFEVTVRNAAHPITREMKNFQVTSDERYVMKLAPGSEVLLTVEVDGEQIPNTWTRMYGKGRVFYTGLGHDQTTFANDTFLAMVARGIKWAIEDPIP